MMNSINAKTLAVASGKGGVGKTTTAVNIAVYYARIGFKTAIIDIDPLSDISTLFDIELKEGSSSDKITIFDGLDLFFPHSKINKNETPLITRLESLKDMLSENYDKIILDFPAGSLHEENLIFLQYTSRVIVVTNDEPTSHTASGFYIKKAYEYNNDLEFYIWHNKYAGITVSGFDPHDLQGNYNRNVPEEEQVDFSKIKIKDAAYIPIDPVMDLLKSNPSINANILARMIERIDFIIEQRIDEISENLNLPKKTSFLIRHYLHLNPFVSDVDSTIQKVSEYIFTILNSSILSKAKNYNKATIEGGLSVFTDEEKSIITNLIKDVQRDSLMTELLKTSVQLRLSLEEQNNSEQFLSSNSDLINTKPVDRKVSLLLQTLNSERKEHNKYIKATASLLQFDFALFKLFHSETVIKLVTNFIPQRVNSNGVKTRDRHKQILMLIKKNNSYKKEYIKLIRILFPVVIKQLSTISETFNIAELNLKTKDGLQKKVYLKILSNFLHNSLNSGLGIITGFPFSPASEAFDKYTKAL